MKLTPLTTKELQTFVGKVCTIVTPYVTGNFAISNPRFLDYFVGRVDSINDDCVCVSHLVTGSKSVFFEVVAIVEEQIVGPEHPEYEELKRKHGKVAMPLSSPPPKQPGPFVSIEEMEQKAIEMKNRFAE